MPSEKPRDDKQAGLPRLPPGRHGLPREFVVENQRRRIAAGAIAVVVERGYVAATVTQIVAAAGVSRRTFYNYYGDKEKAFADVFDQVSGFLLEAVAEAGRSAKGGWAACVKAQLAGLLDALAANPDLARFCFSAPPAAGGEIAGLYREFLDQLRAALAEGRPKRAHTLSPAAEYGLAGGLAALIVSAVEEGGADALRALRPEVTELVLTPYLGREEAARIAS